MNAPHHADGTTELVAALTQAGIIVTREAFIEAYWDGSPPVPWGWEEEAELPPELRLPCRRKEEKQWTRRKAKRVKGE